jgi:hypothetical protein
MHKTAADVATDLEAKNMNVRNGAIAISKPLWFLIALYSVASLLHFIHNAEYIAFYPNMPQWITSATVYKAWLGIAAVGIAGIGFLKIGWSVVGAILVAAYGALGIDGLAHFSLALCSQHSLAANLTIWFEVLTGAALMFFAGSKAYFASKLWFAEVK